MFGGAAFSRLAAEVHGARFRFIMPANPEPDPWIASPA
jgi:hypothetical protein